MASFELSSIPPPTPQPPKLHPLTPYHTFSLAVLNHLPLSKSHATAGLCSCCFICVEHPSPLLDLISKFSSPFRTQFTYQLFYEDSPSPETPTTLTTAGQIIPFSLNSWGSSPIILTFIPPISYSDFQSLTYVKYNLFKLMGTRSPSEIVFYLEARILIF